MAKQGQNRGNQNAGLKPGQIGRIQWTEGLSGHDLEKFIRHFKIDTEIDVNDERELQRSVAKYAKKLLHDRIGQLPNE